MTYVKTYLPTLKTHVVNLKRDANDLSRDLQRLEVRGKLGSKTLYYVHNYISGTHGVNTKPFCTGTQALFTFHLNWKYHPWGLINDMQMSIDDRKHWHALSHSLHFA